MSSLSSRFRNIKIFILVIIGWLITGHSLPQANRTDLEVKGLKGSVKSVMETKYAVQENDSDVDSVVVKDTIIYQKLTFYNDHGYETETRYLIGGSEVSKTKYLFGPKGMQIRQEKYNQDGKLFLRILYKYDSKGYRVQGSYEWLTLDYYKEMNERKEFGIEDIDENLITRVIYSNNHRGLCEEERYIKADGCISYRNTFRYDYLDNKVEKTYYKESGRVSWRSKYKYDRYGNLAQLRLFKDNRIAIESNYSYDFDEQGNWVTRYEDRMLVENIMTSHLNGGNTLTERKIEYYE